MDRVAKTFLLPCSCAAEIEVVAGQAGGEVVCPACGRRAQVPKLRELSSLPVKPVAAAAARPWSATQALVAAGAVLAALCIGSAAYIGAVPTAAYSPELIRAEIDRADDLRLYQALFDFAAAPVNRAPSRDEVMLKRKAEFALGMARVLYGIGGVAALAAIVAYVSGLAGSRPA